MILNRRPGRFLLVVRMALRPLCRRWTPEDNERLKALVAQGASLVRAAAALKRKQATVRERAKKLGCPFPTVAVARKKWSGSANSAWRLY
jgi:transposase-like protein